MAEPLLHQLKIASPCTADWESMKGSDQVRYCQQCDLRVYNLSAMDTDEAAALVSKTEGRLCVRFHRRADGTVLTQDCPVGLARVRRRLKLIAASLAGIVTVASTSSLLAMGFRAASHRPAGDASLTTTPVQFVQATYQRFQDWLNPPSQRGTIVMGNACPPGVSAQPMVIPIDVEMGDVCFPVAPPAGLSPPDSLPPIQ